MKENARWNAPRLAVVLLALPGFLCPGALSWAQGVPPPPPMPPGHEREFMPPSHMPLRPPPTEEEREERRQRREAWRQMTPEERHQLRRDIRDAGHMLYPRGQNFRRN